jgi:hypothetical protein
MIASNCSYEEELSHFVIDSCEVGVFMFGFTVIVVSFFDVLDVKRLFFVDGCEEGVDCAAHFDGQFRVRHLGL